MFMTAVITVIAAYLLGSVNFAVIFTKAFAKKDVRKVGSGNAGATNVLRAGGVLPASLTFVCDFLKGALSALLGLLIFSYIYKKTGNALYLPIYGAYICGVAAVIGHVFPLFFDFKGGKGVATGVGVIMACCPIAACIGLLTFIIVTLISKIVSLSSLVATFLTVLFSVILYSDKNGASVLPQLICALIIGGIIFIKHIPNIKRILNGEESRLKGRR